MSSVSSRSRRRRAYRTASQQLSPRPFDSRVYQDLALASGGNVIQINSTSQASNINALITGAKQVTKCMFDS